MHQQFLQICKILANCISLFDVIEKKKKEKKYKNKEFTARENKLCNLKVKKMKNHFKKNQLCTSDL